MTSPRRERCASIVVFGASGDLAKKKTFPALFGLFRHRLLPENVQIIGYARSQLSQSEFHERVLGGIKVPADQTGLMEQFRSRCTYMHGDYDSVDAYTGVKKQVEEFEKKFSASSSSSDVQGLPALRIYYLALPPAVFHVVAGTIKKTLHQIDNSSFIVHRLVVEKPFGKDLQSSNELSRQLAHLFHEDEIYRIDHYLGKEMVKNIMVFRFANLFFSGLWNRQFIHNVQITFKEPFGTEGRGGYFDEYGIIRDVVQNHLLQVLSVTAMERPVTLSAEDVRDEKVKVLKCIKPLSMDRLLVGQYGPSLDGKKPGYLDDKTVPQGSICPTYSAMVLYIDNERWNGVPWILKAGKALNEQKAEIRIQFNDVPGSLFSDIARNELVIRVQPNEAVYMKIMNKKPGLGAMQTTISELDLSYKTRYSETYIPDAYEALILDVLNGDRSNFVRVDELECAWKIFTPVLHELEEKKVKPELYSYGSRGPEKANEFIEKFGFVRHQQEYIWSPVTSGKL